MPDRGAPDPIDMAYRQAEAALGDDEARAARRARVLAAVAREAQAAPTAVPVGRRRWAWRQGGGLAAAAVAGLSVLLATHFRQATPSPTETAAQHPARAGPPSDVTRPVAAAPTASSPTLSLEAPARHEARRGGSESPNRVARPPHPSVSAAPPPAAAAAPAIPPPPVPPVPARVEEPPALAPPPRDTVVTARRRTEAAAPEPFPAAESSAFAQKAIAGTPADQAARLADAAAGGRIGEVKALLAEGVPVDAIGADGETALMKSVRAGQVGVAAFLHGHGASLDRENRAGESAREMAAAKGDARLDRALGLAP